MTQSEAKAFLPLIKAFSEGKTIQSKSGSNWEELGDEPQWSMHPTKYRIKPEPKTVPLTIEDLYEHFKKGTIFKNLLNPQFLYKLNSLLKDNVCLGNITMSFQDFLHYYTFEDGTPLTKIVEE